MLRPGGPDLPGSMLLTLLVSFVAFTILFAALLVARISLEEERTQADASSATSHVSDASVPWLVAAYLVAFVAARRVHAAARAREADAPRRGPTATRER